MLVSNQARDDKTVGHAGGSVSVRIEHLTKAFGSVVALHDVSLDVSASEMLVLVGPSGCGKTTCLRCLAGLERPTKARISIGDRVVFSDQDHVFVNPEKRQIGMVFQSYAVWPHMTVFENVAYPLRAMGAPRSTIRPRVEDALRLVQLDRLADRYSSQLSGGQQQRVALARSLVAEPKLLLFDEPLSNLDAGLRVQMRQEIRELQKRLGFTGVYVTHDQAEALAIADRVAVMEGGHIRQIGSSRDVYDQPVSAFVAKFMGATNLLDAKVRDTASLEINGGFLLPLPADAGPVTPGETLQISARPEALKLRSAAAGADALVAWPATVNVATFIGDTVIYNVQMGPNALEVREAPNVVFDIGSSVFVVVDPARCRLLRA